MQSKIRVLDENTINKIAAGEVIENPSSVVKELVDNSIDAGATEITVEITGGGRQLIRITDDGCGMSSDDAVLCLERHATSKIKSVEDILTIQSMGFRGEAIPSIASVSKFTLITSHGDGEKGTMVIVEGGKILKVCEAVRSRGTTIEVKSLFFNVPVRKKFQRSPNYDSNEIQKMLAKLAMANPEIKIELISNQKHLLETKKPVEQGFVSQLSERLFDVLGEEFVSQCCPVENIYENIEVYGYIGLPAYTRHNRTGQYVFINRRPVFSPLIHNAVREGYSTTLPTNRHPLFVIHILMPGELVDVNVHPQKREVRLRQEQDLKRAVTQAVDKALHGSGFTPVSFDVAPSQEEPRCIFDEKGFGGVPLIHEKIFERPSESYSLSRPATVFEEAPNVEEDPFPSPSKQAYQEVALIEEQDYTQHEKKAPQVIGTIPGYIIVDGQNVKEMEHSLVLVDQKAAHSRVVYEALLNENRDRPVEVQQLLVPVTLDLTQEEAALLQTNLDELVSLGIGIKEFGKNSYMIDAIPTVLESVDLEALIHELVHSMENEGSSVVESRVERLLATHASRISMSRKSKIGMEEARILIDRLFVCKHPYQSPTGSNTLTVFGQQEIAKRF